MVETKLDNKNLKDFGKIDTDFQKSQLESESKKESDGLNLLINDHETVFRMFDEEFMKTDDLAKKREIMDRIITELSKHSAIEEMILYPMMRWTLDDGETYYKDSCADHQDLKENLQKILDTDPSDSSWLQFVSTVISDLRTHIRKEEDEIFVELRKKLSDTQLSLLYYSLSTAKLTAPTRPHPWTGSGAQNWFVGPPVAAFDKLKEAFGLQQQ